MPPRFAYWTILVDNQPTSFRSSAQEDLLPTFNRLKAKNPSAVMMWFQGGKLWPSRLDAQEAMRARGDIGRRNDPKQERFSKPMEGEGFSPRPDKKLEWKPKGPNAREVARRDWKPKPYTPKPEFKPEDRAPRAESWKRKAESREKPEWKPKGSFAPERKPRAESWKPKADGRPEWRAKSFNPKGKSFKPGGRPPRAESWKPKAESREKPEWKPKGSFEPEPRRPRADKPEAAGRSEKLDWQPKSRRSAEGAKADEFRDRKKWRPGGDHKDPRQKYKDAKKAKWTRFKQAIRSRSSKKRGG